ncbi:preprotein translocase subunit YajC [Thiohalorhabdus methylotrophus]|uniref:Sec translocon accessory complex subunit YajC n=1 Tax=Thiohalorhabdus methylotrophus TaxID=3242694 RepID=A0ABV4U0C5_9GAMM
MPQSIQWISTAHAQAAGGAEGPGFVATLVPLILIFVIFYLLIIRPQSKRMKQHREMVRNLEKGDEVVTGGGFYGRVVRVNDESVTVELAEGVRVKAQRESIQTVLPKGSLKD